MVRSPMYTRLLQAYTCILLIVRVVFIFVQKDVTVLAMDPLIDNIQQNTTHSSPELISSTSNNVYTDPASTDASKQDTILASDYVGKQANITILKDLYTQNPTNELLHTLIDVLLEQHRFDEAYGYVQEAEKNYPDTLDPYTHIYAVFHAPSISISQPGSIKIAEDIVAYYRSKNLINTDDYIFYQAIIKFWYDDFAGARILLQQLSGPKYASFATHVLDTFTTIQKQTDIPGYYGDALVSLSLMKQGYYSIAKKIATAIILKDKQYILPYQILAHSHFMTHNRDTAIEYFLTLRELESKQEQRYTFLIGVAHYRKKDYTQAIMYLNQVRSDGLLADAYRYIFLSYIQAQEYSKASATRQKLLGNTAINTNDFYSYFYEVFFAPIRRDEQWPMYRNIPLLAQTSIEQCFTILATEYHDVCRYGQAGQALATNNLIQAKNILDELIHQYDEPYLFHALGDYYRMQGDYITATQHYNQAISLTHDTQEGGIIKKKMVDMYE